MTNLTETIAIQDRPICMSGGADGADLQFGMCAGMAGHTVIHWSFAKHRTQAPVEETVQLTQEQLEEADPFCIRANETLMRRFDPRNKPVANLLRRNWYQQKDANALYAVTSIVDGKVMGGTAWATQMFIDRCGPVCEAYVFDQAQDCWFKYDNGWVKVDDVPPPWGIYAGIGTQKLEANGKYAIRKLLGYEP